MLIIFVMKNGSLHNLSSLTRYLLRGVGVGAEDHVEFIAADIVAEAMFEVVLSW
jgi:hypothetical protein